MYVCLCTGVTDHDVRAAVDRGADSVAEVMRCTGAGTRCGSCRTTIASLVSARSAPAQAPDATSLGHAEQSPSA